MFGLFKKKLHRPVTIAVAVPTDEQQFLLLAKRGSDFIATLTSPTWEAYKKTARTLIKELDEMSSRNAKVIYSFGKDDFAQLDANEIIIFIAHHTTHGTIELFDGEISEQDFVNYLPDGFNGIGDFSSCHSKSLIEIAKHHYPQAHFLGVNTNSSLTFKTILVEHVLKLMAHDASLDYFDAYREVVSMLDDYGLSSPPSQSPNTDIIYLGEKKDASIYAPSIAEPGQEFIVQVFIYDADEKEVIEQKALEVDEEAVEKNHKKLRLPLKQGDVVQIQLHHQSSYDNFMYDDEIQEAQYDGEPISFEYIVFVSDTCQIDAFVGKINVAINNNMAGAMVFKVKIGHKSTNELCEYTVTKYNPQRAKEEESQVLVNKLHTQLNILQANLKNAPTEIEITKINKQINLCKLCINIITKEPIIKDNKYSTVFISSTSDMIKYRNLAMSQILLCEMYPEMYENWGQGNEYPCYECCRRVKNANSLICILGPKYGYIEPEIGMSMTEIEYRVATMYDKNILVYIQKTHSESDMQNEFINEIREKRLVRFFESEYNFSESAGRELMNLKHLQL